MTSTLISEIITPPGAFHFLRELERRTSESAFEASELLAIMDSHGVADPHTLLSDLLGNDLLRRYGDRVGISRLGIRTSLLLEAINGADIRTVYDRLSDYESSLRTYELVREGMADQFFDGLIGRPTFGRLYICSPWINLGARQREALQHAVIQSEAGGRNPDILVITRPVEGTRDQAPPGVAPLLSLGATVSLHPRLHTKLLIREPDANGGFVMAVVGSENLTRSNYFELGIRINGDGGLIDQLRIYFLDLMNACAEFER